MKQQLRQWLKQEMNRKYRVTGRLNQYESEPVSEPQWLSSLGTLVSPQRLWERSLGALGGLTGHGAHLGPLVCREPQGAAPAVEGAPPQHPGAPALLPAAAAAVHLPGQTPVGGEALVGQAHQRGRPLLQLLPGGGQHRQGGPDIT